MTHLGSWILAGMLHLLAAEWTRQLIVLGMGRQKNLCDILPVALLTHALSLTKVSIMVCFMPKNWELSWF